MLTPHRATSSDIDQAREISHRLVGEPAPADSEGTRAAPENEPAYVDFGAQAMPPSEPEPRAIGENTAAAFRQEAVEEAPIEIAEIDPIAELDSVFEEDAAEEQQALPDPSVQLESAAAEPEPAIAAPEPEADELDLGADELKLAMPEPEPTLDVEIAAPAPAQEPRPEAAAAAHTIADEIDLEFAEPEPRDEVAESSSQELEIEIEVDGTDGQETDDLEDLFEDLLATDEPD